MSVNIRYPKITGRTPEEKLVQIESWLRQLVDQLNWALPLMEQTQTDTTQTNENNTNLRR